MDDRLDAHWWLFTAQIGQINGKKRVEGRFLSVSSPKNDKVGRGPHGGIERLSGVQMLPPKNFYPKVLEGVRGKLLSRSFPLVPLVPQQIPIYRFLPFSAFNLLDISPIFCYNMGR